ncbi:Uncharacterised protein [Acinetobacter baumannii]|nr:Uncharacterised protein [Acinetobacter baumannii]
MQRLFQFGLAEAVPEAVGAQQENVAVFQLQHVAVGGVALFVEPQREIQQVAVDAVGLVAGVLHLLDQAVVGGDGMQVAAAEQVQATVAGVRPVGQLVIAIDKQTDQRGAHLAVFVRLPLLLVDGGVGAGDVLTNALGVQVLFAVEVLQNGVARQFGGDIAARKTGDAVAHHEAGGAVAEHLAGLILVGGAAALVGGRGYGDIHYASGLVCESLY